MSHEPFGGQVWRRMDARLRRSVPSLTKSEIPSAPTASGRWPRRRRRGQGGTNGAGAQHVGPPHETQPPALMFLIEIVYEEEPKLPPFVSHLYPDRSPSYRGH